MFLVRLCKDGSFSRPACRKRRDKKSPSGQNILLSSSDSPSLHLYVSHVCVYAEQMGAIAAMTRVHVFTFAEFVVMFER